MQDNCHGIIKIIDFMTLIILFLRRSNSLKTRREGESNIYVYVYIHIYVYRV